MTLLQFSADRPISVPEQDEFRRYDFAKRLAKGLVLPKESPPLVVGLEAQWGSGKTSVINLARHHLQTDEHAIVISFSPWLVGARETLIQSFLIQLAAAIQLSDRPKEGKEAAEQLLRYSSLFSVLKLVPGAEPWASITEKVLKGVGKAARDVSSLKQLDIEGQRKKVAGALANIGQPIVVVIDDIDRLPPQEVFEILRFVKAVADFDRVAYLLAYDYRHVIGALNSLGVEDGAGYIEKIVQVRLHLPELSAPDIRRFLERRLERFGYEDQARYFPHVLENLADVYSPYVQRLLRSPRAIVRTVNRLEVSYRMAITEVTFGDLLGLEALAIVHPRIHAAIKLEPERFLGTEDLSFSEILEKKKASDFAREMREELVQMVPPNQRRDLNGLLDRLFPIRGEGRANNGGELRKDGRIAEISRLKIALNLGLDTEEVPLDVIRTFAQNPDRRFEIVASLNEEHLERFVELLSDVVAAESVKDAPSFSLSLAHILARPNAVRYASEVGPASLDREIAACIELAISSANDGQEFFLPLLDDRNAAWLAMRLVELLIRRERSAERLLTVEQEATVIDRWQKNMVEDLLSGRLLNQPFAGSALFAWRRIPNGSFSETMRAYVEGNDENFIAVARILGVSIIRSSVGAVAKWGLELIEQLGEEGALRERAKRLLSSHQGLDNRAKAALLALSEDVPYTVNSLEPSGNW